MTHRQYLAWQEWLEDQWNNPDRHDAYLMAIRAEIRAGNSKEGTIINTKDMRIPFVKVEEPAVKEVPLEDRVAASKAAWVVMGGGRKRTKFTGQ